MISTLASSTQVFAGVILQETYDPVLHKAWNQSCQGQNTLKQTLSCRKICQRSHCLAICCLKAKSVLACATIRSGFELSALTNFHCKALNSFWTSNETNDAFFPLSNDLTFSKCQQLDLVWKVDWHLQSLGGVGLLYRLKNTCYLFLLDSSFPWDRCSKVSRHEFLPTHHFTEFMFPNFSIFPTRHWKLPPNLAATFSIRIVVHATLYPWNELIYMMNE